MKHFCTVLQIMLLVCVPPRGVKLQRVRSVVLSLTQLEPLFPAQQLPQRMKPPG